MKTDKQEHEQMCGNPELPHTANESEKIKLVSFFDSLKVSSADVEQNHTDLEEEQPGNDDIYELPTLFSLIVQRYEGETWKGQFHGEGVACFEGGQTYKGMFSKGLMDGCGVFTLACGLKYEGEFVCNMPMGLGTYTWPDGSSYKGEVYNGIRHGTGTYKCAKNGVSYTGQWDQGKRQGKGEVYYDHDKTSWYKGDWVKNNREGWGVRRYPSGNMYSGEWKNNLRHGEGTMRWLKLGQQYVGMWQNGVQHGGGTHTWIPRPADGSLYSQSNQYTGDFVHGQRHGQGTFYYAGGAIYENGWRKNKKHGKGKFTFEDGHVFEGEFVDDLIMRHNLNGNKAPTPLSEPGISLDIECVLEKIPERKRDTERKQVEFEVLKQDSELRSIYGFYKRLGHAHSSNNIFQLSRLQLWRLLKDCNIHHYDITLTQIDHMIREDATTAEIHSPFTPMLLHRLISCLVVVAYHIYHKDMMSQNNLLAACFSKLMTDNILPNAKNVKGFLFRQPDCAVVAVNYLKKSYEVYQANCKVNAAPREDQTMTCRHLLWMFRDLHLLDNNLTTARLLQVITAESRDHRNLSSCLDLEITFLEFFEVLLGSAEVKCQPVSEDVEVKCQTVSEDVEVKCQPVSEDLEVKCQPVSEDLEVKGQPVSEDLEVKCQPVSEDLEVKCQPVSEDLEVKGLPVSEDLEVKGQLVSEGLEVKGQPVSEGLEEGQSPSSPDTEARRDLPEVEASENIFQTPNSPSQSVAASVNSPITPEISSSKSMETSDKAGLSTAQEVESEQDKTKINEKPQAAEHTGEGKSVLTRGMEAKDWDMELWNQTIHQFFNHFFFPAFEHNRLVSKNSKEEKLHQEAQRRIALAKAQQRTSQ
ncbi:radial spoke head 10 homolog B isoform X2 [Perca flavescens]|uniref:radial spoke head 10 homolog B isoform X2 n=1 Tax=Perca flavescens TaxID=8167 RepID=UPI00106DFA46|nr:radial spoke head 10 homolog B2 isoform X2 [Perca flavescens]